MKMQEIPMVKKKEISNKLFNFRPLFFSAVFFVLGIILALTVIEYDLPWWIPLFILPVFGVPFCFISTKEELRSRLLAVGVLVVTFLLGIFSFCLQAYLFTSVPQYNGEYTVRGKVVDFAVFDNYTKVELTAVSIDGECVKGKLIAYLPGDYPEKVELSSIIEAVGDVETNTRLFDEKGFRAYAVSSGVRYYLTADNVVVTGKAIDVFLLCRQRFTSVIENGMEETSAQTLLALLFGETSGMDEGFLQNVRSSGIAHVFAVSGLHFGSLFGCLVWILNRERLYFIPKWLRFLLLSVLLYFYGGICGFSASVVRAIVVCLTFYGTWLIGVETDWLERISLACLCCLLLSPSTLLTAGFLLSFGACYGIALLSRHIEKGIWVIWGKVRALVGKPRQTHLPTQQTHPLTIPQTIEKNSISFVSVTLSAQAFTAPILLYAFGSLSAWSLLLNCIFVPIIGVLFPVLLVFVVLAALLPSAASGMALHIPNLLVTIITLVFEIFDFTKLSVSELPLPAFAIVCYYFGLLLCTDKWNAHKRLLRVLRFTSFVASIATIIIACI